MWGEGFDFLPQGALRPQSEIPIHCNTFTLVTTIGLLVQTASY
jgi:hypothetical protein